MQGTLTYPSDEFVQKLEKMERIFKCHHGDTGLKGGSKAIQKLTSDIRIFVQLPEEVIRYFVKYRMFFRLRVLNRAIGSSRKKAKKMSKILK